MVAAIKIAFKMVPIPGFSLNGIHNSKTMKLTKNVDFPIDRLRFSAIPSAKTVHGVFPSRAEIRTASPAPKIINPTISKIMVEKRGFSVQGSSALHQVVGTFFAGRRNSISPI